MILTLNNDYNFEVTRIAANGEVNGCLLYRNTAITTVGCVAQVAAFNCAHVSIQGNGFTLIGENGSETEGDVSALETAVAASLSQNIS